MFDGGGHQAPARALVGAGNTKNCRVIALGSTTSKYDLTGLSPDKLCYLITGLFNRIGGSAT